MLKKKIKKMNLIMKKKKKVKMQKNKKKEDILNLLKIILNQ